MLNSIVELVQNHGIANVNVSIKPHGNSIAATINLVPDLKAVNDETKVASVTSPIVLIGADRINDASAESILATVVATMQDSDYFNATSINERIKAADSADTKKDGKKVTKAPTETASKETTSQDLANDLDDLFGEDSL